MTIQRNVRSSIEVSDISVNGVAYRADPPLRFCVRYDADDELHDLNGDFGISLWADSRSDLLRELHATLSMLWMEYATERPDRLSGAARHLRTELRQRLRAV